MLYFLLTGMRTIYTLIVLQYVALLVAGVTAFIVGVRFTKVQRRDHRWLLRFDGRQLLLLFVFGGSLFIAYASNAARDMLATKLAFAPTRGFALDGSYAAT